MIREWPWVGVALALGCASSVSGRRDGGGLAPERPVDLCGAPDLLDANARGFVVGSLTTLHVSPADWTRGGVLPPSEGCGPRGASTHRLVVRYTPRTNGHLTVSAHLTRPPASPLDTSAVIDRLILLDGCRAAARRLACEGLEQTTQGFLLTPRRLRSPATMTAGVPVYLVLSGAAVEGTLTFAEVSRVSPLGGRCDLTETGFRCVAGSTCVSVNVEAECRPDGSRDARCRRGGTPCDPGLACIFGTPEGFAGHCLPAVTPGTACPRWAACLGGVCDGLVPDGVCHAYGTFLGPCRVTAPRCDSGLTCRSIASAPEGRCITALPSGARCGQGPSETACPDGESCALVGEVRRCVRDGTAGGWCRLTPPTCEAGLVCGPNSLDGRPACGRIPYEAPTEVTRPGEDCSWVQPWPPCAAGSSCQTDPADGSYSRRLCVLDGASGGACRAGSPACDPGLVCGSRRLCVSVAALGSPCATSGQECEGGAHCLGTCHPNGEEGTRCRSDAPYCNDGLTCQPVRDSSLPTCVRTLSLGDDCNGRTNACGPGLRCLFTGIPGSGSCVRDVTPAVPCAGTGAAPSPCPPGTRCELGLCRFIVASGQRCDTRAVCEAGTSCLASRDLLGVCTRDGGRGARCRTGSSPCDDGLQCQASYLGDEHCVTQLPLGSTCYTTDTTSRCALGLSCDSMVCRLPGSMRASCRTTGAPCDAGLACGGSSCEVAAQRGEPCHNSAPCVAPMACVATGNATGMCTDELYTVEVRSDVTFEDPCLLPIVEPRTPLSLRLLGVDYDAALTEEGAVVLRARTAQSELVASGSEGDEIILTYAARRRGCSRIVGEAPRRRVLFGGGQWTYPGTSIEGAFLPWEVILHEGSNAVEFRYAPVPPGAFNEPRFAAPRLTGRSRLSVMVWQVPVNRGTSARFTPR